MHFQRPPHGEVKIVECTKGAIWDVIIDIRPKSPSFGQWRSFELTAENRRELYIPAGFAHGFETLSDDTEVRYLISTFYEPLAASGLRHDDPAFAIPWPLPVAVMSDKDQVWPGFEWEPESETCGPLFDERVRITPTGQSPGGTDPTVKEGGQRSVVHG